MTMGNAVDQRSESERQLTLLREIAEGVRELVGILQVAHGAEIKKKLETALPDNKRKRAYHFSTGENSSRAVAELAGVSDKSVRDWWKEWFDWGLVEPARTDGRYRRKYNLPQFGISVRERNSRREAKGKGNA